MLRVYPCPASYTDGVIAGDQAHTRSARACTGYTLAREGLAKSNSFAQLVGGLGKGLVFHAQDAENDARVATLLAEAKEKCVYLHPQIALDYLATPYRVLGPFPEGQEALDPISAVRKIVTVKLSLLVV
jgi:hypothetical protein